MIQTAATRRTHLAAPLVCLLAAVAGTPIRGGAQASSIYLWGNDPARIGGVEAGSWFPSATSATKWSCGQFTVPCAPPNGNVQVSIGYLAYATARGVLPPGLPLAGRVTLDHDAGVSALLLGTGASGRLDMSHAALASRYVVVGNEARTDGHGVLQPGAGTLNVTNGGSLRVEGPSVVGLAIGGPLLAQTSERAATVGTVHVSGTGTVTTSPDAFALLVGAHGSGTLHVTAGGTVNTGSSGIIAWLRGSTGTATVDGAGSSWSARRLAVGSGGTGSLTISNGGHVGVDGELPSGSGGVKVGGALGSHGRLVVTGAGSELRSTSGWGLDVGTLGVSETGSHGTGELVVERGASVTAGRLFIEADEGTATALVDDATVTVTGGLLVAGAGGPNALTVRNGATVSAELAYVGSMLRGSFAGQPPSFGPPVSVLVDDATLSIAGALNVATTRYVDGKTGFGGYGGATVKVRNGGRLTAGSLTVGPRATLDVDPATVEVLGDFTLLPGGTLAIGVEGGTAGLVSRLQIGGVGVFQGNVFVDFLHGFAPSAGQIFDLVTAAGGVDFSQATIGIRGLAHGFQYGTAYANGTWSLTAITDGVAVTTPEPGSAALLASGLGLVLAAVRRPRRT